MSNSVTELEVWSPVRRRHPVSQPDQKGFLANTPFTYLAGCILISMISVHDSVLLIVNHQTINQFEENPVGRMLLWLGNGEVWLFVVVKLLTTSLVATALIAMFDWNSKKAWWVMSGTLVFQLTLLWYLTFGE